VGQKFTSTQLVSGSIAFKLFNLGQTFRVAIHKLPTISWVCHALVIVSCVFVICLGRPGCDMGLYVVFRIGVCINWECVLVGVCLVRLGCLRSQLILVVSDWEPYLGSLSARCISWVIVPVLVLVTR
jgi:hypothetical protein